MEASSDVKDEKMASSDVKDEKEVRSDVRDGKEAIGDVGDEKKASSDVGETNSDKKCKRKRKNIYLIMSECTLASNNVHGDMIKACIEVYNIRYIL